MKCAADTLSCGYDFHDDQGTNLTTAFDAGGKYSTAIITKRAVDIIYNHNPEQPLFLFVSFQAVHSPLQVPLKYEKLYFHIPEWKKRLYAGMVTAMDDAVGRIVSAFRGANLWRNTVLVFSTDNGGSEGVGSNLPLYGGKGSLWEGGIRGVGFVTSQLLQEKEFVYRGLIHISDWFPTLINLANGTLSSADPIDGFDMWDSISTRSRSPRKEILHNIDPLSQPRGRRVWKDGFNSRLKSALRVGQWKIITGNPGLLQLSYRVYPTDQNVWLFNIRRDPMERRDLSRLYPGKVYDMLQRLAVHQATAVPVQYPDVDMLSDPQLRDGVWGPWMASVEGQEGSGGSGDSDQVKSLKMF